MSKKQIKKDLISIIEKMEINTYLLPESWSDEIQMATRDMSYKTYVGKRGIGRYINFVIKSPKLNVDIDFRGDDVRVNTSIDKPIKVKEMYEAVLAIYEEKHSFIDMAEGVSNLRKQISEKRRNIETAKKEIKILEQQIIDKLQLKDKL